MLLGERVIPMMILETLLALIYKNIDNRKSFRIKNSRNQKRRFFTCIDSHEICDIWGLHRRRVHKNEGTVEGNEMLMKEVSGVKESKCYNVFEFSMVTCGMD